MAQRRTGTAGLMGAAVGALVVACALGSGCAKPTTAKQGQERDISATYRLGELSADLPPEAGVLAVQAAATSALRARGYVVTHAAASKDRAYLVAQSSADGSRDKTVVETVAGAAGTRVRIEPGGGDGEAMSRGLLDGILTRLGR